MENEQHFSGEFINYFNNTVRPLAVKCAVGYEVICESEAGKEIAQDDPRLIALNKLVDPHAPYYIGCMIGDVDKHIIKGIRLNVLNSISQVKGCLTSESYWTNVWKNDKTSEEAKNLIALAEVMETLFTKL